MKTTAACIRLTLAGVVFAALAMATVVRGEDDVPAPRQLKSEISQLLIADAAKAASRPTATEVASLDTTGVIELAPLTVRGLPERRVRPVYETRVEKFVRTGVLWQSKGRNPAMRLWMAGDKGLMISFGF